MSISPINNTPLLTLTSLNGRYGEARKRKHKSLAKDKIAFTCDICNKYMAYNKMSDKENICVYCDK